MVMPFRASSKDAQLWALEEARNHRNEYGEWNMGGSGSIETMKGYADRIIMEYQELHPNLSYDKVLDLLQMHIEMDLLAKESELNWTFFHTIIKQKVFNNRKDIEKKWITFNFK